MKRFILLTAVVCLFFTGFSQQSRLNLPESMKNLGLPAPIHIKDAGLLQKPQNDFTAPKSAMEVHLGTTVYDLQTNTSVENRFYIYPDNTMYGTWTRGMTSSSFPERGTGYNQYDGTSWGPAPTVRIENERCGWPSYAPLGPTGEIVVSHTETAGLKVCTRTVKGTGTWTQSILAGPAGAIDISWPRVLTTGTDHNVVHIITLTYQVYQGLNLALLYWRSQDGGQTWDIQNEILPGMDAANGLGYGGDDYAWGSPKGDTIYFLVNGQWSDAFIMTSYNAGTNWTKIPVFNNGYKLNPSGNATPIFTTTDGSGCVEMDKEGVYHVVMGRMRAMDDGSPTPHKYYPYTDGLIYWNSTLPLLSDSLFLDTLDAHGQLLGYVAENASNDPLVRIPYYGVCLSSFPQITIDDNDAIFVIWSGITVGNPYVGTDSLNYRHLWFRKSFNHGVTWTQMEDFNKGLAYIYREFVFPSMAKYSDEQIHYIYQSADVPGSCVKDATNVSYHTNTIEYRATDKINVGIEDRNNPKGNTVSEVYPNPVKETGMIRIDLVRGSDLTLDIFNPVGQKVMSIDKGFMTAGSFVIRFDANNLKPGVYFCTIRMNNSSVSKKMIVQ
ncbi:MAG: T9SS type A sorting domain-containing protein [Bacteroidetes bacterium]|nr:T9SS type A sorting domain-containing protein [Bacteroidota bacterium]